MVNDNFEQNDTRAVSFPLKQPLLSGMLAIIVAALSWAGFQVFEWLWFLYTEVPVPTWLSRAWATLSALVVGLVGGAWVIRQLRDMPLPTVHQDQLMTSRINEQRINLAINWFIAMRWLAVFGATIMIFLGVRVYEALPSEVTVPLILTAVVLAGLNVFYLLIVDSYGTTRSLLFFQALLDLMVLTVLLHFSGGIENPLMIAAFFHVLIGGILLSQRECFGLVAIAVLLFCGLGMAEATGRLPHYTLAFVTQSEQHAHTPHSLNFVALTVVLYAVVLFITAYFVTSLSKSLRQNEIKLSKIAGEALEARHLLVQALETTSTGLRVLGANLVPFWSNLRWEEWFGHQQEECRILPELDNNSCPARDCLRDGDVRRNEINDNAGLGRTYRITTAPLHDSEGRITRIVQLAEDVTEEKKAHEQLMQAGRMAAVGELAGRVAHEVNNPVGIISAKANLMLSDRKSEMSEKVCDEVTKIRNLSDRIGRIAQGLLSYSRPSSGQQTRQDLRAPVRVSFAFVRQQGIKQGIEFIDELGERMIPVRINAAEVEQIFLNLFLNAIQAMPDGGKLRIVRLPESGAAGSGDPDWAGIAVEDSGPGIDPTIREQIFQPFFTTKTEKRGTGLGLSVCHGLVQSHGGRIEIAEASLGGARFNVWFRVRSPNPNHED
ncbi:MAG: ATP-binding protein [Opitutales bacterium]